jgi:hypothetical protein
LAAANREAGVAARRHRAAAKPPLQLAVGDLVLMASHDLTKLVNKWLGPFAVVSVSDPPRSAVIQGGSGQQRAVAIRDLKRAPNQATTISFTLPGGYIPDSAAQLPLSDNVVSIEDSSDVIELPPTEGYDVIDEVLKRRGRYPNYQFLVKWRGVDANGRPWKEEWVPQANIDPKAVDLFDLQVKSHLKRPAPAAPAPPPQPAVPQAAVVSTRSGRAVRPPAILEH